VTVARRDPRGEPLEQVIVIAVDQRHLHGRGGQGFDRVQATEAASDHDNAVDR
jgi:hypothetical protein